MGYKDFSLYLTNFQTIFIFVVVVGQSIDAQGDVTGATSYRELFCSQPRRLRGTLMCVLLR